MTKPEPEKVRYEELLPHEFEMRLSRCPVGYLPIGTLEWHGPHNPLGTDSIQARGLFERAARQFGGIVFPPIWLGPDRIRVEKDGKTLIGMDYDRTTNPPQQLLGSCYWVSKGFFITLLETVLIQAKRAGFRCMIAGGHGPSGGTWSTMAGEWEEQYGLTLMSLDKFFPKDSQMGHAGKTETSVVMGIVPHLVDLTQLPGDRITPLLGVSGEDPREASEEYGEKLIEATLNLIGKKLEELKI